MNLRERIASLPAQRFSELTSRLERKSGSTSIRATPITRRVPDETQIPLLPSQHGIWLIDQMYPGLSIYNLPAVWRCGRPINVCAVEQAVNEVIRRHEVLRSTFPSGDGAPVQLPASEVLSVVPVVDLQGLTVYERKHQTGRLTAEEKTRKIDLESATPIDLHFLMRSSDDVLLLQSVHHIAFDASSSGIYMTELRSVSKSFAKGVPSDLEELQIQCGDLALWYKKWALGPHAAIQLDYWKRQLAASSVELRLQSDGTPEGHAFTGGLQRMTIPAETVAAMRRLAGQEGATLFMAMLSVFRIVLWRHTGQTDINIGTLFSTRTRPETMGLIGPLFNTLVMRTQLDGKESFREFLAKVRKTTLSAFRHAEYPFNDLVDTLRANQEIPLGPLFQVKFGLGQSVSPPQQSSAEIAGDFTAVAHEEMDLWSLSNRVGGQGTTVNAEGNHAPQNNDDAGVNPDAELALYIHADEERQQARILYNADHFGHRTITRLLQNYTALVADVALHPDRAIQLAEMLTAASYHHLVHEWNDTAEQRDDEEPFMPLFESVANGAPDSVAAEWNGEQISYRELNRRSGCLAEQLQTSGVRPEGIVVLATGRNLVFLISMLATFRLGAAYLPLDLADPDIRLAHILRTSHADVTLCMGEGLNRLQELVAQLPPGKRPKVISVGPTGQFKSTKRQYPLYKRSRVKAYVIYTSGSSGVPKGVMIEQLGMVNHLRAKIDHLRLGAADVVAQNARERFDISVWQFLAALLVGARVWISDDETARSASQMFEAAERRAITVLELVPSLLMGAQDDLASDPESGPTLSALRWLLVTGEAVMQETCDRWLHRYPQIPLMNAYGPTECSDDVCHYVVRTSVKKAAPHVPIGRPLRNTRLYLLDDRLSVVPIGVTGEVYIGGKGVGRGYFGDPSRTAEAFMPDPFSDAPGARLYRTGDIAFYLEDGNIEYRGRCDTQVKIRGCRIELSEIEAALELHPSITQAIVLSRMSGDKASSDPILVAYLLIQSRPLPGDPELTHSLAQRLPAYMLPAAYVKLESFPLTSNGKVDRHALQQLDTVRAEPNDLSAFVAPTTRVEMKITEIWTEVLRVNKFGIYDNFFNLGGHSIRAVKVANRINHTFGVKLSLRHIFDEPTIAGLALLVEEKLIDSMEADSACPL
jgi:amino acid adenylation domain-containing protein